MTTYSVAKDPTSGRSTASSFFGRKGRTITKSDTVDLDPYAAAVVVITAGDLVILPTENTDDANGRITFTAAPVGFIPPFKVRRVHSTGTTAVCAAVDS